MVRSFGKMDKEYEYKPLKALCSSKGPIEEGVSRVHGSSRTLKARDGWMDDKGKANY